LLQLRLLLLVVVVLLLVLASGWVCSRRQQQRRQTLLEMSHSSSSSRNGVQAGRSAESCFDAGYAPAASQTRAVLWQRGRSKR
jgi:hypothetical protein